MSFVFHVTTIFILHLKMETAWTSEILVSHHNTTWNCNPQQLNLEDKQIKGNVSGHAEGGFLGTF
jgi:hypothetical protein